MAPKQIFTGMRPALTLAVLAMLAGAGCSDRAPDSKSKASTAPAAAPAATPAPSAAAPVQPGKGEDPAAKGGTTTGMIGGESGTVAASGKPDSGTASGGGTGAAQSSGSKTATQK